METNIDLAALRFNGNVYRQKDLEQRIVIPERNELIVDTYCRNVAGRRAVTFCVSVSHSEEMAQRFRDAGVSAASVSGFTDRQERANTLRDYQEGRLRVLCACDVLNEGWDAPETEVLLMARPTLSKVVYQQQLGRGMRSAPGKECLIVFDFVDVFSRHNRALSLHRLLRKARYRAGSRVFCDDGSDILPAELPLHLWAADYQQIDIFDWHERVEGMVTAPALAARLRKSEEWVKGRWRKGEIPADEVVDLGQGRHIPYFCLERLDQLREQYGLVEVTAATIYEDFLRFLRDMDMTHSYKPVWLRSVLSCVDDRGSARVEDVTRQFHQFYIDRAAGDLVVEKPVSRMTRPAELTLGEVQQVINQGPFNRFERLGFIEYGRDRAFYRFNPAVWQRLREPFEQDATDRLCAEAIAAYFRNT